MDMDILIGSLQQATNYNAIYRALLKVRTKLNPLEVRLAKIVENMFYGINV